MFLKNIEVGKPTSDRKFRIPKRDNTGSIIIIMYHKKTSRSGNPEAKKLFSDAIKNLLQNI
jgi:hypothetical protein